MKKDFSTLSFSEKERACESVFIANGPYWHIYTDGTRMQNIFCYEEDFATGMWALAASLHLSKEVRAPVPFSCWKEAQNKQKPYFPPEVTV